MKKFEVVIVGAGAAGIAAGCRFLENKFHDFVILEAAERIGGRLHTIPVGKGSLDLGAEWVHGEKGNCVHELASKLDLLFPSSNPFDTSRLFYSNGKVFDSGMAETLMNLIDSIIDHCDYDEIKAYKGSLGDFFTERYWPRVNPLIEKGAVTKEEAEDFLIWLEHVENSIDGSPSWHQTSADEAVEYVKLEGDVLIAWKVGGYSTVIDLLTKRLPNPSKALNIEEKIRLKKEVKRIDWSGERVEVTCSDGSQFSADRVISTMSLNVLKAEARNIFLPDLPTSHLDAIQGLGMGTVDKIFLEFPYRWWEPGTGGVSLVWRKQDIDQVPKELNWTTGVFGFYAEENHPLSVLCGWIVGSHAEAMEQESDEVVMMECMNLLRRFVGPTVDIPDARAMYRSKWHSNSFVKGSYSCRMVKSNTMDVWPGDLAKPVMNDTSKQVLFFAGEATHDHLFSTVHGAIESGRREADRILSFQERNKKRRVTIVGAGIAGLAAANALAEADIDFVVLEAQASAGGRMQTMSTDTGLLELGAQWLHGEKSDLHKLAAERGLVSDIKSGEGLGRYCRPDGSVVPSNLVDEVNAAMLCVLNNCEKYVGKSKHPVSIGHELEEKYQDFKRGSKNTSTRGKLMDEIYSWQERFQLIDNSCNDLHDLSAKAWGLFKDCGRNHCINLKGGFSSLIDVLMKNLPEGSVMFNSPVRCIEWVETAEAGASAANAKVICDNMEILSHHVIVTTSLGFLKENKNRMFVPQLPQKLSNVREPLSQVCDAYNFFIGSPIMEIFNAQSKRDRIMTLRQIDAAQKAIDALGFGTITKLYLVYDKPWWSEEDKGFQFVWRDDALVKDSVPWAEGTTGFDIVPGQPVMLGWVGGHSAAQLETIPEPQLKAQATELLQRFTANNRIPQPKAVLRSKWHSNEFVKGAYSYISNACDAANITSSSLSQPVYTKIRKGGSYSQAPTILLAGEACHKNYYSTCHGAYDSGKQQATVVIDYVKKMKSLKL